VSKSASGFGVFLGRAGYGLFAFAIFNLLCGQAKIRLFFDYSKKTLKFFKIFFGKCSKIKAFQQSKSNRKMMFF